MNLKLSDILMGVVCLIVVGMLSYVIVSDKEQQIVVEPVIDLSAIEDGLSELSDILLASDEADSVLGFSVNSMYTTSLAVSATSATTAIKVDSSKLFNGEELTTDFPVYLTVNANGSNVEILECWEFTTSTTANWWGSCNRGLSFSGNNSTSTISSNQKAHGAGEPVAMTNVHYVYDQFVDRDSAENIGGLKNFTAGIEIGTESQILRSSGVLVGSNDDGVTTFTLGGASASSTSGEGIQVVDSAVNLLSSTSTPSGIATSTNGGLVPFYVDGNFYRNIFGSIITASSTAITGADGLHDYIVDVSGNISTSGTLYVNTSTTSTFIGPVNFTAAASTSTFSHGIAATQINVTGSATSTFANGISLADGCFLSADGTCANSVVTWEYISTDTTATGDNVFDLVTVPAGTKAIIVDSYHSNGGGEGESGDNGAQATIIINGAGYNATSSIEIGDSGTHLQTVHYRWDATSGLGLLFSDVAAGAGFATSTFYK